MLTGPRRRLVARARRIRTAGVLVAAVLALGSSVWQAQADPAGRSARLEANVAGTEVAVDISLPTTTPSTRSDIGGVPVGGGPALPIVGLPTSGSNTPTDESPACGADEDPAVGCGLRIVGFNDLLGRGNNFNLVRVGSCAYVSSKGPAEPLVGLPSELAGPNDGVAVINVSDPSNPRLIRMLRQQGAIDAVETMAAIDAGDRKVLVVGSYGGRSTISPLDELLGPALDIYDVSDNCTNPVHRATTFWPDNAHNLTLNAAGTRVYGTRYAFDPKATVATALGALLDAGQVVTAAGLPLTDVMVMDINDLDRPRLAGQLRLILPDGSPTECHKVELDRSETRMFCAGDNLSDAAQHDGREPVYSVWPSAGPTIWDISDVARGVANPVARFVGESAVRGQGGHHAVPMTVTDPSGRPRRYLMAANELAFTCDMAAYPRVWDITDETQPVVVSELHLPAVDQCSGAHYNDVDDRERTTMALVGWTDAGFRVFDVRDPVHPRPLAYFKPGGGCYSLAYFDPGTSYIWFACENGFFVADLTPAARATMGVPTVPTEAAATISRDWVTLRATPSLPLPSTVGQITLGLACWLPAAVGPRT